MATTNDEIYERLGKLIEVLENGINFNGNRKPSARSVFSNVMNGGGMSQRDLEDFFNKINENMRTKEDSLPRSKREIREENRALENEIAKLKAELERDRSEYDSLKEIQENNPEMLKEEELEKIEAFEKKMKDVVEDSEKFKENMHEIGNAPRWPWLDNARKCFGDIIDGITQVKNLADNLTDSYGRIDEAASRYARTVGMTSKEFGKMRDNTLDNVRTNTIAMQYGMKTEEILDAQASYIKAVGRKINIDNASQENVAQIKKIAGDGGLDFAAKLDKFGVGIGDTAKKYTDMWNEAVKSGISFDEFSNNVVKNLNIAQNYTFKNGLKGLESMAKKATTMKLDMQQIANLADKVSSVEGAVNTSAKLQVLGGPFAQMADPLSMLNEGLNDMEGLQDRIIKMIGGLGSFNKDLGEVKVSTFNRLRIKEAANAMGMDYNQLMESVHTQARRNEVTKQIEGSGTLSGFDEELKELIRNTASFKDGKAGVTVDGKFKALDSLTSKDAELIREELKAQASTRDADIKSIVANTKSLVEYQQGLEAQKDAEKAGMFGWLGEWMKKILGFLGYMPEILSVIIAIQAMQGIGSVFDSFGNGKGKFKNLFKRGGGKMFGRGAANSIKGNLFSRAKNSIANFGRSISSGVKSTGGKLFGKTASKAALGMGVKTGLKGVGIAARLGKAAAAGGGIASVATVAGALGDIGTDALVEKGKIKKGGAAHNLMSGASNALAGAAAGAAIGSIIPGIGTAIGAVVGGAAGLIKGLWKAGGIQKAFKGVKSFGQKAWKKLNSTKGGRAVGNFLKYTTPIGITATAVNGIKNYFKKQKRKNTLSKPKSKAIDVLNKYSAKIKPVMEKGAVNAASQVAKSNKDVHISSDPQNINLNGTLSLRGENGQQIDLIKELKNNPTMLRNLSDMISNEMGIISKGGNIVQR